MYRVHVSMLARIDSYKQINYKYSARIHCFW